MDDFDEFEDSNEYMALLQRAQNADLSEILKCDCVSVGENSKGHSFFYVIPLLGLKSQNSAYSEKQILEDMLLLFLKMADSVVKKPYSIVYGHSIFSFYSQVKMMRELFLILPRRYKKNIRELFIIHPTARVHMFFQMSKLFLGRHVSRIVKFLPSIAEVQKTLPHIPLRFPPLYIQWEDVNFGHYGVGEVPSLISMFDSELGAPRFVVRCVEYLRQNGICREGIFRVAGDQVSLEVGRNRFRDGCVYVLIGSNSNHDTGIYPTEEPKVEQSQREGGFTPAYVLVDDVDEVAQVKNGAI